MLGIQRSSSASSCGRKVKRLPGDPCVRRRSTEPDRFGFRIKEENHITFSFLAGQFHWGQGPRCKAKRFCGLVCLRKSRRVRIQDRGRRFPPAPCLLQSCLWNFHGEKCLWLLLSERFTKTAC